MSRINGPTKMTKFDYWLKGVFSWLCVGVCPRMYYRNCPVNLLKSSFNLRKIFFLFNPSLFNLKLYAAGPSLYRLIQPDSSG